MIASRGFALITAADFIVRSAYQMGKTPLLPLFAAALGAGDVLLGFIVSVSTLTGMVLKPFFGILSDRWGRRIWLLVGTGFFVGMPFVYRFVDTPEQLFTIRMFHGLATAIYGPVTLAYVAELSRQRRAERLAWFSSARNAGYVVGPAAAGWMLLTMDPVSVFTVIGVLSSAAFLPILVLPETASTASKHRGSIVRQAVVGVWSGARTPAVWLAGGMNASILIALYAARAFVPLHVLAMGMSVFLAGAFFSVQQITHIALTPVGGRISDRIGHLQAAGVGMTVLGVASILLTTATTTPALVVAAVLMGLAQALVFPSTLALVSIGVNEQHMGLGMGLVGTLKNAGKVAGPALAGLLIYWFDFETTFRLMGLMLLIGSVMVFSHARYSRRSAPEEEAVPA